MRNIVQSSRFKKDLKRMLKRGCKNEKLVHIVELLTKGISLPERTKPHMLVGASTVELWSVIYRQTGFFSMR